MTVRFSGNIFGRDKMLTNTMVGEHKGADGQAGSLTASDPDRLCESESEKKREEF